MTQVSFEFVKTVKYVNISFRPPNVVRNFLNPKSATVPTSLENASTAIRTQITRTPDIGSTEGNYLHQQVNGKLSGINNFVDTNEITGDKSTFSSSENTSTVTDTAIQTQLMQTPITDYMDHPNNSCQIVNKKR